MQYGNVICDKGFKYIDTGDEGKETIMLLHGLFGTTGNFESIHNTFKSEYRIVIPILPIQEIPLKKLGLPTLVDYIAELVEHMQLTNIHILGNSLGGHIAQLFVLRHPCKIASVILTGSSGLFENNMGGTYLKRGDYEYVRGITENTFYDPKTATKEMVDEVYEALNNRNTAIRLVATAKSAIRNNLEKKLVNIKVPTLLIWGEDDRVTPPFVAEKFKSLIKNSKLFIIEKCGHAPMMERPEKFNSILKSFLHELKTTNPLAV